MVHLQQPPVPKMCIRKRTPDCVDSANLTEITAMARVASCPQCNHELLVPSEANDGSWAKCPECRAYFQVKQATSREVLAALLVEADEQQTIELGSRGVEP